MSVCSHPTPPSRQVHTSLSRQVAPALTRVAPLGALGSRDGWSEEDKRDCYPSVLDILLRADALDPASAYPTSEWEPQVQTETD